MKIHYLMHAPFEKLGAIETWLNKNNYQASCTHTYKGETLPALSQFDLLIIMGGPQSILALEDYPYLKQEIALTKEAILANKAVLGVCLGAQIIGAALGAKGEPSGHKEIGFFPIKKTVAAAEDPVFKQFPTEFAVMHWHNDMPGLPDQAVLLAESPGCERQAFRYGDKVYAFQFHMEFTNELVRAMVEHCAEDLIPSQYVQAAHSLLTHDLAPMNQKMYLTLDYLAQKVLTDK